MKFISFSAMSNQGIDKKVNEFIVNHPEYEIIDIKYSVGFTSVNAAILYR